MSTFLSNLTMTADWNVYISLSRSNPSLNLRRSFRSLESFWLSCFTCPCNAITSPHTIWLSGGGAGVEDEEVVLPLSRFFTTEVDPAADELSTIIIITEEGCEDRDENEVTAALLALLCTAAEAL